MQNTASRLFEDLRQRRQDAWVEPWHRVAQLLQQSGGIEAARAAQDRGEELLEGEPWPPSDVLTEPLRRAFARWWSAGELALPPPPSEILPIPEIEADVWDAARRGYRGNGTVDALLQLACLRAYREVHGDARRSGRRHLFPSYAPA